MKLEWINYFFDIAKIVATRSSCDRARVGCVLTIDRRIISTGYNGSPPGMNSCDEIGHDIVDGHCIRTIHAEMNAINQAARLGISTMNTVIFITHFPCFNCFKSLISAGIKEIYYFHEYRKNPKIFEYVKIIGGTYKHGHIIIPNLFK